MAYTVGQVEVDVLPNARRFQEELGRQVTPTAKKVGQDVGDELSRQAAQGLTRGLKEGAKTAQAQGEQAGGSFASGFQKRVKAALESLPDAKVRLNVADTAALDRLRRELTSLSNQRVGIDVSAEEAEAKVHQLQAELAALGGRTSHVQLRVDTAAASAELAKFKAELAAVGDDAGQNLTQNAAASARRGSPLIVAAISGGLIAGAPAVLAAGTLLFGGIAAAAVHSQAQVHQAAVDLGNDAMAVFKDTAAQTVPLFVTSLQRLSTAMLALKPQFQTLFSSLADPIQLLTTGVINLAHNAMPGLIAVTQSATPVFQGLASFLGSIGTGVSNFLSVLAQHGPAAGQVFASLGTIVQNLLPALGEIIGAGVELASQVLPPLASALGVVNSVLHALEPVLPAILAGFLAFKAVSILSGPLGTLSAKLQTVAADAEGMALKMSGGTATAVSGLASSLPVVGLALGALSVAYEASEKSASDFATAMLQGGNAAKQAQADMDAIRKSLNEQGSLTGAFLDATGAGVGLNYTLDKSSAKYKEMQASLTPLQRAQQDVTVAQNEYNAAVDTWGATSGQAIAASATYRDAQDALKQKQDALALATNGVNASAQANEIRLQGVASAASAASSTINALKGALDALTGAAITADQAQIAVTQATDAAKHALDGQRDAAGNLTSALVDANGNLNLQTAAGAAAAASLINLSGTMHQQIATLEQQGASTADVSAKTNQLRDDFYNQARQMGLNDAAAHALTDRYFGIPGAVNTEITADTGPAQATLNKFIQDYSRSPINLGVSIQTGRQAAASGGFITGPGGPRSDSIPAMLSNGEFVINAASTQAYRPLLEAINGGGQPTMMPGFASGGLVDFMRWMQMSTQIDPGSLSAARAKMTQLNSVPTFGGGGSGGYRDLGRAIAAAMGYASQFGAIDYIFTHESGWNPRAQNPTSTAYGIPQFLNSTWGAYGGKTSDPAAQIRDGIQYMANRYGSPNAAAAFWQSHHWYHDGGIVQGPAGANVPAVLTPGEMVLTPAQQAAVGGGVTYIANVTAPQADPNAVARAVAGAQRDLEFLHG